MEVHVFNWKNTDRETLLLQLKIYGFGVTLEELDKQLQDNHKITLKLVRSAISQKSIDLIQVKKIYNNSRGTVKLVLFSDGSYTIINRKARPEDVAFIEMEYQCKEDTVWEELKEGMYVFAVHPYYNYYGDHRELGQLTDAFTVEEAEKVSKLLLQCWELIQKYDHCQEMNRVERLITRGLLTISALENHYKRLLMTEQEILKAEEEEAKKREEALQNKIIIDGKRLTLKTLDNHTYTIVSDEEYKKEEYLSFVYRHRYNLGSWEMQHIKENTFLREILDMFLNKPIDYFTIQVDDKEPVKISAKTIQLKNGVKGRAVFLNDRRVALDDMIQGLWRYFIEGQPLMVADEEEKKQEQLQIRKEKEEKLINNGISGVIVDLEGEFPVSIAFEKQKNNWYLVVGDKRLYLKGGTSTIKAIETVLSGKATRYEARHSSAEFVKRLARVVGQEQALEVLQAVKEFGRLAKALG